MAQNYQAPAFVMVALLLLAAATPTAYGLGGNQLLTRINVNGQLCCSSTGNCNGTTAGISGVPVSLNCTTRVGGASVMVGQGVTGVNGAFNITVFNILRTLEMTLTSLLGGNQLPCVAFVNLPINQTVCPILNTATGILAGVPVLVDNVIGALENLACLVLFHGRIAV